MTFYFISLNYYSAATLSSLPLAKEAKAHGARSSALAANSLVPRVEALGPYRLAGDMTLLLNIVWRDCASCIMHCALT